MIDLGATGSGRSRLSFVAHKSYAMLKPDEIEKERIALVRELGIFGIKAGVTLNSGASFACIALLASAISSDYQRIDFLREGISISLHAFMFGLVFSIIAIAITYISVQLRLADRLSIGAHLLIMMAPMAISYILFTYGFFVLAQSAVI